MLKKGVFDFISHLKKEEEEEGVNHRRQSCSRRSHVFMPIVLTLLFGLASGVLIRNSGPLSEDFLRCSLVIRRDDIFRWTYIHNRTTAVAPWAKTVLDVASFYN